ncbi:unnamed protein product [Rotaria sordida]|uniref:Nuclear receptor domain-containing protein n=1 Tax=Rotaria sordida TaxID=392033 RepID=A0A818IW12_9BILA|nr:unnamed protein product [Rotaria sordida]
MNIDCYSITEEDFINEMEPNNNDTFDEYFLDSNLCVSTMIKKYDVPMLDNNEYMKKPEKKNLQCTVCGARAFGYNFDRITCESCKAFFRRNALKNIMELKCRFDGNCDITIENRRFCTYCRIKKCFAIGMRKEWIRSEQEKNKNRTIKQTKRRLQISILRQPEYFNSLTILCSTDRISLNNITHCYDQYTSEPSIVDYCAPQEVLSLRLHDFYNRKKPIIINFISYFKHLPDFQQLNIDDQATLIKRNIRILLPINYALLKTPSHSQIRYTYIQTIGCINNINLHSMYQILSNTFVPFVTFNPLIIKLLLIILFFTTNLLSTNSDTVEYKQSKYIRGIQSSYIELLWLYMIKKYGQERAVNLFTQFITRFIYLQTKIAQIDSIIRLNNDMQYIDSLMKVILQLT